MKENIELKQIKLNKFEYFFYKTKNVTSSQVHTDIILKTIYHLVETMYYFLLF